MNTVETGFRPLEVVIQLRHHSIHKIMVLVAIRLSNKGNLSSNNNQRVPSNVGQAMLIRYCNWRHLGSKVSKAVCLNH